MAEGEDSCGGGGGLTHRALTVQPRGICPEQKCYSKHDDVPSEGDTCDWVLHALLQFNATSDEVYFRLATEQSNVGPVDDAEMSVQRWTGTYFEARTTYFFSNSTLDSCRRKNIQPDLPSQKCAQQISPTTHPAATASSYPITFATTPKFAIPLAEAFSPTASLPKDHAHALPILSPAL